MHKPTPKNENRWKKPALEPMTTTLWDYPSQHYGTTTQGDKEYAGATPSYVVWNLLNRYTKEKDLVVDPMCGSGTTLDVARDLNRRALGYDLEPFREDIFRADARKLPLETGKADFVFIDPPYGTHLEYGDDPRCIGKLDANSKAYYEALELVIREIYRILKPGRYMALYCSDSFRKKEPFAPIGVRLFNALERYFTPIDHVAVVRHNRTLKRRNFHTEAEKGNFFLRGFNHLLIFRKTDDKTLSPRRVGSASAAKPGRKPTGTAKPRRKAEGPPRGKKPRKPTRR